MNKKKEGSISKTITGIVIFTLIISLLSSICGYILLSQTSVIAEQYKQEYYLFGKNLNRIRVHFAEITCMERDIAYLNNISEFHRQYLLQLYETNVDRMNEAFLGIHSLKRNDSLILQNDKLETLFQDYIRISQFGNDYFLYGIEHEEFLTHYKNLPFYPYAGDLSTFVNLAEDIHEESTDYYLNNIFKYDRRMKLMTVLIIAAILTTFLILSIVAIAFIRKSLKPIQKLMHTMSQIERGNFDTPVEIHVNNEIGRLADGINHMSKKISQLIVTQIQNESKKRVLELDALKHEINPHFLYHTINSIHWIAKLHNIESIEKMTLSLIRLLHSQFRGDEFISLSEEIFLLENYFSIQHYRFPNKFTVDIDIPSKLKNVQILRMILQPLCENAIFHGIQPLDWMGHVKVSAKSIGESIEITISDNGVGLEEDTLRMLNSLLSEANPSNRSANNEENDRSVQNSQQEQHKQNEQDEQGKQREQDIYSEQHKDCEQDSQCELPEQSESSEGFGLAIRNIMSRLQLHYSGDASLTFTTGRSGGTTCTLFFPKNIKSETSFLIGKAVKNNILK